MKVVLITDVKKVGRKGEVHEVANGYAMNVLIPQKLAIPGTAENLKKAERAAEHLAEKRELNDTLLAKNLRELDGKTLRIEARSNEKGNLFQTIRARDVAEALAASYSVAVPESTLHVEDIRSVGEYTVRLKGGGVAASFSVVVS